MKSPTLLAMAVLACAGCTKTGAPSATGLSSFDVSVGGVFLPGPNPRTPLPVVSSCLTRFSGQVPPEQRGTRECPYEIPRGEVEIEVTATALGDSSVHLTDFFGPVAYRVVPGDLTGTYPYRWSQATDGVAKATIKVAHTYGQVRVWAEDAPPEPIYADGGLTGTTQDLPIEPAHRTFATGLSPVIYFEEPTLAKLQIPDGFDNRSSPLVGQFITVGKKPESGETLLQSCADDSANNGKPSLMVVTGLDPGGFFVTDLTACRLREDIKDPLTGQAAVRVPEPGGFLPGTYASMYVYNYSFPEGLSEGDTLFTLSGAVQEFTSTTQLTFPSWTIAERVRLLPPEQWNKYLKFVKPVELNLRQCGLDDVFAPFVTDTMCGHNRRNLKLESLESALVAVKRVKFPEEFVGCDFDADNAVPFFCESKFTPEGCAVSCGGATPFCNVATQTCSASEWGWRDCAFDSPEVEPKVLTEERLCNIDCSAGLNAHQNKVCSERATYDGFGQFIIEMAGPGPAEAGLDPSLKSKLQTVLLGQTSAAIATGYSAGAQLRIWCDGPARLSIGDSTVTASATDFAVAKNTLIERVLEGTQTHVAFIADGTPTAGTKCVVAQNSHTRINLIVKDAVPDLQPNCRLDDPAPEKAEQCRLLRAATYDVVGHLRHLQPGRPRWMIMPRNADDICCHPGTGLSCPKPLKPCR